MNSIPPAAGASEQAPFDFKDVTGETGITFRHTDGSSGRRYIVESVASGLTLLDYDGDGDVDIYFINGSPLKGTTVDTPPRNALYRNDGGWKFTDVTDQAGVGDTGYGLGVAAADYDNDGDLDIYVNNDGPNVLYRNNGDGTFTDVTKLAGVDNGRQMGAGACFLDMEGDGDLDLFVSSYIVFTYETHVPSTTNGFPVYVGPRLYPSTHDTLYRNNGDGTFTDVSEASGIAAHAGAGMGVIACDFDNDGDTDIFVANDREENFLFQNDGKGSFQEIGLMAGIAYDIFGSEQGSMAVEAGDYDNDGLLDMYVTSYQGEQTTLYRNLGEGVFDDVTRTTGAGVDTTALVTWGAGLVDFDNDGDRDLFIAAGHTQDNIEKFDDRSTYHQKNVLLMNTGKNSFVNAGDKSGPGLAVNLSSRGAAFDDLDNDGDVDAVILNSRRAPTILRNDSRAKGHWLQVQLQGVKANRDGVGAQVRLTAGSLTLLDEVHSGRSYQSHYGMRLYFGLGPRDKIDQIEVRWVGGAKTDVYQNIDVDRLVILKEGGQVVKPE